MRIAHIHRSMGTGGIEAMICGLVNEMSKEHDVTVCTIESPAPNDRFYNELSPAVHRKTIGGNGKRNPLGDIVKIARFVKDGHFDIVQLHCFFYYFILAILLYHCRLDFYYTVHSDACKENKAWDRVILPFKKFCFRRGWVHPITISPTSQTSFVKLYKCDSQLIPNGVVTPIPNTRITLDAYKVTEQTMVFVHAGRICPEKNQVMLCKVFDRLIQEGKDIALVIAGPIHWHSIFNEMQGYFCDRVHYIGNRSDISALLCVADGMCLTSHYEGFPIILLESIAAGCVPVCTPVGGIIDVIKDGVDGFLAKDVTEESYYRTMMRYLNLSNTEREKIKTNCRLKGNNYTIERCARAYLDYYIKIKNR